MAAEGRRLLAAETLSPPLRLLPVAGHTPSRHRWPATGTPFRGRSARFKCGTTFAALKRSQMSNRLHDLPPRQLLVSDYKLTTHSVGAAAFVRHGPVPTQGGFSVMQLAQRCGFGQDQCGYDCSVVFQ